MLRSIFISALVLTGSMAYGQTERPETEDEKVVQKNTETRTIIRDEVLLIVRDGDTVVKIDDDELFVINEDGDTTRMNGDDSDGEAVGGSAFLSGLRNQVARELKDKPLPAVKTTWLRFDFGFNMFMYDGIDPNLPSRYSGFEIGTWRSNNIDLHIFKQGFRLTPNNHLTAIYGLTYSWDHFSFLNDVTLESDNDGVSTESNDYNFSTNYLVIDRIGIPLELQFESNPKERKKSFRVAVGANVNYLVRAKLKQESSENGEIERTEDYNVNKLSYGALFRIGYGRFNFYANYDLSPLFRTDRDAPELNPFTVGLTLTGFHW